MKTNLVRDKLAIFFHYVEQNKKGRDKKLQKNKIFDDFELIKFNRGNIPLTKIYINRTFHTRVCEYIG